MIIRKAKLEEVDKIAVLLKQVSDIHSLGRPDIFKEKSIEELIESSINCINDQERNMLVAEEKSEIIGIVIYKFRDIKNNFNRIDTKTLSVDELVVEEKQRSKGVGKLLLDKIKTIAKQEKCDNIELNCWSFNIGAMNFYKDYGMKEQRVFFELKVEEE